MPGAYPSTEKEPNQRKLCFSSDTTKTQVDAQIKPVVLSFPMPSPNQIKIIQKQHVYFLYLHVNK